MDSQNLHRLFMLSRIPLFADLTETVVTRILGGIVECPLAAAECLFHQGDIGRSLFIVDRGYLQVLRDDTVISTIGSGQMVGEIALLADIPRTATVKADEDSLLLALHRDAFFDVVGGDPASLRKIVKFLLERYYGSDKESPQTDFSTCR